MSEDELPEKEQSGERPLLQETVSRGSVGKGVGLVLLLHLLQFPVAACAGLISLPLICVTQAIYVIPAFIIARRKGHEETAKGIIIAASITALLNIACSGYVFYFARFAGCFCVRFGP
jgi:hypothetical protein